MARGSSGARGPSNVTGPSNRIGALIDQPVSMRSLALLRVLAGPIVVLHLWPFLHDALGGTIYRDHFYEPYAAWYPELPRTAYLVVLMVGAASAVAMSIGISARWTTKVTFAAIAYNLFLSTTHFHSNRAYLVTVLGVLALARTDGELVLWPGPLRRRPRPARVAIAGEDLDITNAPAWPLWLLRFEAATVYGASGLSKLLDPDWIGGTVPWLRVMRVHDRLVESPLPGWAVSLISDRDFHTAAAKVIVAAELFVAIGFWFRPTRLVAIWLAVAFHLAIELSASVQVFSLLAIAVLVIWATPTTRDRVLMVDRSQTPLWLLARFVSTFDWLARFRIEPSDPGGVPMAVVDRDGNTLTGPAAVRLTLSRLPLTAWLTLPTLAPAALRRAARPARPQGDR